MNYLKLLKYSPILIAVILFFLWSLEKKERKTLDSEKIEWKKDSVRMNADKLAAQDFSNKLQKAKTRKETYYQEVIGSIHKEYGDKLSIKDKLIDKATNKKPDTLFIEKPYLTIKSLEDSFKTTDLDLNYFVSYYGKISSIDFDYTVHEKTVVEEHIIYEPVDRPVYLTEVNSYYFASYSYGGIVHDLDFGYISRSRVGFKAGLTLFDKKIYPKVGVVFLFRKK